MLKTLDAKKVVFGFSSAVVDSNVIKSVAERLSMYSKVQVEKVENMSGGSLYGEVSVVDGGYKIKASKWQNQHCTILII